MKVDLVIPCIFYNKRFANVSSIIKLCKDNLQYLSILHVFSWFRAHCELSSILVEWMNEPLPRWLGRKGGHVWYLTKISKVLLKNNLMNVWGQQEHKESPNSGVTTSVLTRGTRPVHRSQPCNRAPTRRCQLPPHQDADITTWQFCAAWRLTRVSVYTTRWWEVLWQRLKQLEPIITSSSLI